MIFLCCEYMWNFVLGIARPIQPRSQSKQSTESRRKKRIAETHVSGERMRHFADDDKYSLHEMVSN